MLQNEKPSGGAAVQAYSWIHGLKENGHQVQVFTAKPLKSLLKQDCSDIDILPIYDQNKGIRWMRWLYYRLPYIYSKLKDNKPEYLYQGIPSWQSYFLSLICSKLKIKFIIRISNDYLVDDRFYAKSSKIHGYFMKLGMRRATCILCQNEYQFHEIKKQYPQIRMLKIPNPIVLSKSALEVKDSNKNYIAWLGLFQYQKNVSLLYDIACALKYEHFLIAGKENSSCDSNTLKYLELLKALPNVKFVGFLERADVTGFLREAKFLLNTSHYEGFSNTFLESMAVGTPIITSSKVNPDNIIDSYELGIVYNDVVDLQLKFTSLSTNTYDQMKLNAFDYVRENHDYKVLANKLVSFLLNDGKKETISFSKTSVNKLS